MNVVKDLALDHPRLAQMKSSYVTSFVNAVARMGIEDQEVWSSLGAFLIERCETFSERDLSTHVYALYHAGKKSPLILNFDDIFKKYELQLVKRFEAEVNYSTQSVANSILAYSKTQNGSVQFFRILEGVIIREANRFSPQELSNIVYSYHKSENAQTDPLLLDLRQAVMDQLHTYKPVELCQVLTAYTEEGMLDESMIEAFDLMYKVRYEDMKPEDSATFFYCFTKAGFKGSGRFYRYLQKSVSKTIGSFEGPHLRLMFYKFDHEEESRLNRGVRGRLIDHCMYLARENKLKGFDANEIYEHTRNYQKQVIQVDDDKKEKLNENQTESQKNLPYELISDVIETQDQSKQVETGI